VHPATPDLIASTAPEDHTRHTVFVSLGTIVSRVTGFLRIIVMVSALGVVESRLADAYNVASTATTIIYDFATAGLLSSVFVPVFVEWGRERGSDEAWKAAQAVAVAFIILLAAATLIGFLAAPWIVRLYTVHYPQHQQGPARELATFLLRWFMPQVLLYGMIALATAILNAHRRFSLPVYLPIVNNLVAIASFGIFAYLHRTPSSSTTISAIERSVLGAGGVLGVVVMTALLWIAVRRLGFRWKFRLDWRHPVLLRIRRLAGWAFLTFLFYQINTSVILIVAGSVRGAYTAFSTAFMFFQLPHAIFAMAIATVLLPSMSSRWSRQDAVGFRTLVARGLRAMIFVLVPTVVVYSLFSEPLTRILLEHGVATTRSAAAVAQTLAGLSVALIPFSLFVGVVMQALYAMQDTKTPALIYTASVAINVVATLILFPRAGLIGLGVAQAIAPLFATAVGLVIIRKRSGGLEGREILKGIFKTSVAGLAAFLASLGLYDALSGASMNFWRDSLRLVAAISAGTAVYVIVCWMARVDEIRFIRNVLRSKRVRPSASAVSRDQ
jgi:putative peptidoglycan lipid II flippase